MSRRVLNYAALTRTEKINTVQQRSPPLTGPCQGDDNLSETMEAFTWPVSAP